MSFGYTFVCLVYRRRFYKNNSLFTMSLLVIPYKSKDNIDPLEMKKYRSHSISLHKYMVKFVHNIPLDCNQMAHSYIPT